MEAPPPVGTFPRTVEEVFKDFTARRAAVLNALTVDVEEFYRQCDPEKDNLCLYGFPNEAWEVNLPAEEVPPELPEPALGINFARDGMNRRDWLSLVAAHSDAWLVAVAFYFGARFEKNERMRLFNMINEIPTVFDIVTGRKVVKERAVTNNVSIRNNSSGKARLPEGQMKNLKPPPSPEEEDSTDDDDEEEDDDDKDNDHDDGDDYDDEHGDTACGTCGGRYTTDEFWIGCDVCEGWFHGRCVKVTPARAEHIKQYKCPSCSNKRVRV